MRKPGGKMVLAMQGDTPLLAAGQRALVMAGPQAQAVADCTVTMGPRRQCP